MFSTRERSARDGWRTWIGAPRRGRALGRLVGDQGQLGGVGRARSRCRGGDLVGTRPGPSVRRPPALDGGGPARPGRDSGAAGLVRRGAPEPPISTTRLPCCAEPGRCASRSSSRADCSAGRDDDWHGTTHLDGTRSMRRPARNGSGSVLAGCATTLCCRRPLPDRQKHCPGRWQGLTGCGGGNGLRPAAWRIRRSGVAG